VGLVQALVFALLCAVFTKLICEHHEDHDEEDHAEHDPGGGEQSVPADATSSS
jgi:hypothetical protein